MTIYALFCKFIHFIAYLCVQKSIFLLTYKNFYVIVILIRYKFGENFEV